LPGHALALSLQKVWEIIRDQKDLNLPAHKVFASTSPSHSANVLLLVVHADLERLPRREGVLCAPLKWGIVCQVMVANIRCAEIMEEQLRALGEDQAWLGIRQEAVNGLVPRFGERAAALLDSCLSGVPLCNPCCTLFLP